MALLPASNRSSGPGHGEQPSSVRASGDPPALDGAFLWGAGRVLQHRRSAAECYHMVSCERSLSNLLLLLDEFGLSPGSPAELRAVVSGLSCKRLGELAELLRDAVPDHNLATKPDPLDIFNFLASSAIRGDSGCSSLGCQTQKLVTLSRFAALYADRVMFPVDFAVYGSGDELDRHHFFHSVNALNFLRPLIEQEIIQPVRNTNCVCVKCLAERGVELNRLISEAEVFWRERVSEFTVVYWPPLGDELAKVMVSGPREFLPHGGIRVTLRKPLDNIAKQTTLIDGRPGVIMPEAEVFRQHVLSQSVFSEFLTDLIAQQLYGLQFGATYLTDMPGQAKFFGSSKPRDESMANAARLCGHLAHSVPLFSEAPIRTVLEIRAQEPEAFIRYRSTLNDVVREHIRPGTFLGPGESSQLYNDVLRPRIAKLRSEVVAIRRRSTRKAMAKIACSFAAITLGVVNGLLPTELAKLFTAVGGVSLLKDIGEALAEIQHRPSEVRNNDLYFLLELEQGSQPHE